MLSPPSQEDLRIEGHWRVNGTHYARTSEAWLTQMDTHKEEIMPILGEIYGEVNGHDRQMYEGDGGEGRHRISAEYIRIELSIHHTRNVAEFPHNVSVLN